ncbi:DUF2155 domain-containing protein [Methylocapsa polymorpha]|uniref:DUF2155 domain-containing protein n=1 Tax=Methylocapsa polymorpha TaxID=3080828 RepID=A0ABZ0HRS8_9HYPH|nr:DUF2155 domain-containing protein [Methylocapsa sp. RX1]
MRAFLGRLISLSGLVALSTLLAANAAWADKIKHPIAVFSGLDKITGRIIVFEVATDETVQFGSLQITERVCYTRPSTETPQTTTFIEVDEVDAANEYKRIFSGWMFAASPGLHGIEHPVYDIWLTGCKGGGEVVAAPETTEAQPPPPPDVPKTPPQKPAQRQRRAPPVEDFGAGAPTPDRALAPPPQNGGPIEVGPPPGLIPPAPVERAPLPRF